MIREDAVRRGRGLVEESACLRLRQLAAAVPADQEIVELGAYQGQSTGWLLLGAQDGHGAHVTTVDPWERRTDRWLGWSSLFATAGRAFQAHMRDVGASDATLAARQGFAAQVAAEWYGPVGLLFHDAGHGADEVEADLRAWLPHLAEGAVVALHDAGDFRYGVGEAALRLLGSWDTEMVPWLENPAERGLLIARRRR